MLEETPEEQEVFSAMEQSSVRKETIRSMDKYLSVMEELSVARFQIRQLTERLAKLEKTWVGLSEQDINELKFNLPDLYYWVDVVRATEKRLKDKNT
jgi:hypothetical protein